METKKRVHIESQEQPVKKQIVPIMLHSQPDGYNCWGAEGTRFIGLNNNTLYIVCNSCGNNGVIQDTRVNCDTSVILI